MTFTLTDQVGDGPWNATATLRSGLNQQTSRARITFPHAAGTGPAAAAHPAGGRLSLVMILTGAILIALLAAITVLAIITYRRRGHHRNRPGVQPDNL